MLGQGWDGVDRENRFPGTVGYKAPAVTRLPPLCIPARKQGRREREESPPALRAARPHTVGYIGGCDQEEGGVGCLPHR